MESIAINVDNVSKIYRLYNKPSDRLKEALGFSKKKLYQEHYALNNVSFEVRKGETVGIIGTNGSGKSTILKIITGVLNPTQGNVSVQGRISALLELGAGFNMEYTGIENIYLNGTMMGFSEEEINAKMDDILSFADIGDFVHQPVKTYSSGMSHGCTQAFWHCFRLRPPGLSLLVRGLTEQFLERIKNSAILRENMEIIGRKGRNNRTSTVSLYTEKMDMAQIAFLLDDRYGIAVRPGLHCAPLAHRSLGTYPAGTLRFSFGYYNREEEIELAVRAMEEIITNGI